MTTDITPENVARMADLLRTPRYVMGGTVDMLEALAARLAEVEKKHDHMVPISSDGNYVFIDGPGDVEIDHGGRLRARAEAAEAEVQTLREELEVADCMVTAEARSSLERLARAEAAEARLVEVYAERNKWMQAHGEACKQWRNEWNISNARVEAAEAENAKLREALIDTLDFLERHSNRWDGINGKHPQIVADSARAALQVKP